MDFASNWTLWKEKTLGIAPFGPIWIIWSHMKPTRDLEQQTTATFNLGMAEVDQLEWSNGRHQVDPSIGG